MGENTIMEKMKCFVKVVKEIFETKYFRHAHKMILRGNSKSMKLEGS
jgi:hypothetical protein